MPEENILDSLRQLLKSNNCPLEQIDAETRIENLQLDSIHLTAFLMDLEDYFSLAVPDEIWVNWRRLEDVAKYIIEYQEEFSGINLTEIQDRNPEPESSHDQPNPEANTHESRRRGSNSQNS